MTSYLVAAYGVTPFPKLWAERLAALMKPNQPAHIVDLGSGSGGPIPRIVKELGESGFMVRVTLTDLLKFFAAEEGHRCRFVPVPWQLAYWPLRAGEFLRLPLPFRADSLLGLVRSAPGLSGGDQLNELGVTLRAFPGSKGI